MGIQHQEFTLSVSEGGRTRLPNALRETLGLTSGGGRVFVVRDGDALKQETLADRIKRVQAFVKERVGEVSLVDELIEERRNHPFVPDPDR